MKGASKGLLALLSCLFLRTEVAAFAEPSSNAVESALPTVCANGELIKAIRIIKQACDDVTCDFSRLKELNERVDRPTLLAALRSPYLSPVHIFFPVNKSKITESFDWEATKRDQLTTLKDLGNASESIIFVLGRASASGSYDLNVTLSQQRMASVLSFLRDSLHVECNSFHGAWFGKQILPLTISDANLLNIPAQDYRNDVFVLNQSVHVFVFPCGKLIK